MRDATILISCVLGLCTLGCKSSAERCHEAKVAAYEAWDGVARQLDADEARLRASCRGNADAQGCLASADDLAGAARGMRRIRDRTRGGALRLHQTVQLANPAIFSSPTERAALDAANEHWEACREIDP